MGAFGGFIRNMDIPEEKKEEFTQRALKILEQGGMLDINPVNLIGKQIGLLSPVALNKEANRI